MSVDLIKKREAKVKVSLSKFTPRTDIVAEVNFIIDSSGSMSSDYNSGKVQELIERVFPLARTFDDNKEMGVIAFSSSSRSLPFMCLENYSDYVKCNIMTSDVYGGGTDFLNAINIVLNRGVASDMPVFNIFITDGETCYKDKVREILAKSSNQKIFWKFIGIGSYYGCDDFLRDVSRATNKANKNVSFTEIRDIHSINDENLYDILLEDFIKFLDNFKSSPVMPSIFQRIINLFRF